MRAALKFRDAGPDDAECLGALARQSFTETFGHLYTPENLAAFLTGHSTQKWSQELRDPRFAVRVGECDGLAAAYATVGPPSLPVEVTGPSAELKQFYVLKPWQGTGDAQLLMAWVLDEACRRGAAQLYLSVFIDNPRARRFYQRYGFEAVGRYDFMVGTHADEDIIMRLNLNP